jgi:hypothetical protein
MTPRPLYAAAGVLTVFGTSVLLMKLLFANLPPMDEFV